MIYITDTLNNIKTLSLNEHMFEVLVVSVKYRAINHVYGTGS